MIEEVLSETVPFMVAFFVLIIAFSDSFYILSDNKKKEDRYIPNFFSAIFMTYTSALGDLETDDYGYDFIAWTLFLLCTIFNLIVMLNLLIAIISDTYTRVNSTKEKVALKQRADMILDLRRFPCLKGVMQSKSRGPCDALFIAINEKQKVKDREIDVYDVHNELL